MPNGEPSRWRAIYNVRGGKELFVCKTSKIIWTIQVWIVYEDYPEEGVIMVGNSSHLTWWNVYVPCRARCNICRNQRIDFASIHTNEWSHLNKARSIWHMGIEIPWFDWHPITGELCLQDNASVDMMGDIFQTCGIKSSNSCWTAFCDYPYWHWGSVKDPEFGFKGKAQSSYVAPGSKACATRRQLRNTILRREIVFLNLIKTKIS